MSRRTVLLAALGGLILLAVSVAIVRTLSAAGQFTTIKPLGTEHCSKIEAVAAPEDIAVDHDTGVAYVAATDWRAGGAPRGAVYALDMAQPSPALQPLTGDTPPDFRPLGLSLWTPEGGGAKRLFVVNRRAQAGDSVEVFEVGEERLEHAGTLESPQFGELNDVLALGAQRVLVTSNRPRSGWQMLVDFARQRPAGRVLLHDGSAAREVAGGFAMANGIAADRDSGTIYVTDTLARKLHFFAPVEGEGRLRETGTLFFGTGLDNVTVAPDGTLWLAAHPKLGDLAAYLMGWADRSASQVIRARPASGGGEARTVLLDLGERLSASSVATVAGAQTLIGSAGDARLLACRFPDDARS